MATAGADLLFVGLAIYGLWWVSKGYFGIYNDTYAATGMQGEAVDTAFLQQSGWQPLQPPVSGPYSGQVGPTVSGTFHW